MKRIRLIAGLLALCVLLTACTPLNEPAPTATEETQTVRVAVEKAPMSDINDMPLKDKAALYDEYDPLDVVCFYVTVVGGNAVKGLKCHIVGENFIKNSYRLNIVVKVSTCFFKVNLVKEGFARVRKGRMTNVVTEGNCLDKIKV